MSHILFREKDHSYIDVQTGEKLLSMTTFVAEFKQNVDWEEKAKAYLLKRGTEKAIKDLATKQKKTTQEIEECIAGRELTHEIILEFWENNKNRAASEGTAEHAVRENKWKELEDAGHAVYTNMLVNGEKYSKDLSNLPVGVHSELIIYHPDYKIVGQSDEPILFSNRVLDINDYKTNDKLDFKSFYNYHTGYQMMVEPINHIHDCNVMHYALQLSGYAYLMECHGYTIRDLTIEHTKDGNKKHKLPYLRDEIIVMLNHKCNKQTEFSIDDWI